MKLVDDRNRTVMVTGLPLGTSESQLVGYFGSCGPISQTNLGACPKTKKLFGFIEFLTTDGFSKGIRMDGSSMNDCLLTVVPSQAAIRKQNVAMHANIKATLDVVNKEASRSERDRRRSRKRRTSSSPPRRRSSRDYRSTRDRRRSSDRSVRRSNQSHRERDSRRRRRTPSSSGSESFHK